MNALVFGANGTLGGAIVDLMKATGSQVVTASRDSSKTDVQMKNIVEQLKKIDRKFDSCIWAQGMNTSDTLTNSEDFQKVFDAIHFLSVLFSGLSSPQFPSLSCFLIETCVFQLSQVGQKKHRLIMFFDLAPQVRESFPLSDPIRLDKIHYQVYYSWRLNQKPYKLMKSLHGLHKRGVVPKQHNLQLNRKIFQNSF